MAVHAQENARVSLDDDGRLAPIQIAIFSVGLFCMMLDGFDILLAAFAAPAITEEWGISASQLGVLFGAALLGMAAGAMFLASLADMFGRRPSIVAALLLAGVATLAAGLCNDVTVLIALRFLAGLGLGALLAVLPALVGEYSPARLRNLCLAILVSGTALGGVVGGSASAAVIAAYGWRGLFIGAGALTLLAAGLCLIAVPESMQFLALKQRPGALAKINAVLRRLRRPPLDALPRLSTAKTESAHVGMLLTGTRWRITLLVWSVFFMAYVTIYVLTSWLPMMLKSAGMTAAQSIFAAVILALGGLLGGISFGWLSRWWPLNHLIGISFAIGAGLMALLSVILPTAGATLVLVLVIAIGFAINGAFTNMYTVAVQIYPVHIRTTGIGWCIGIGRGGAVLGPIVAGLLINAGISVAQAFLIFALPILLAAALTFAIRLREIA